MGSFEGIYLNCNWVTNWVITGFMSVPPPLFCTRAETLPEWDLVPSCNIGIS